MFAVEIRQVENVQCHKVGRLRPARKIRVRGGLGREKVEQLLRTEQEVVMEHLRDRHVDLLYGKRLAVRAAELGFGREHGGTHIGREAVAGEQDALLNLPLVRRQDKFVIAEKRGAGR